MQDGCSFERFELKTPQRTFDAGVSKIRLRLFPLAQPAGALAWIAAKSIHVEPTPLAGKLSRDPKDNHFVAAALTAGTRVLATQNRDQDLLVLDRALDPIARPRIRPTPPAIALPWTVVY